ncbi:MAG: sulfatase [Candidatus Hydrogenedentes bacterium]|nr:sulfatase [Candidatus Hydrogenedentota bacterium]
MTIPRARILGAACILLLLLAALPCLILWHRGRIPLAGISRPERVALDQEWRTARRVNETGKRAVDLGPATPGSVVRLGLLPDAGAPAVARVYAGWRRIGTLEAGPERHWVDGRFVVGGFLGPNPKLRVALDASGACWLGPCEVVDPGAPRPPNVLVYLIDTLRLDHVGCYGYSRDTSPSLDALARDGVQFTQLVPQSSWTRPSIGSLLTSTYPHVHGAEDRFDVLRTGLPSLAECLAEAGYETHGLMTNPNCLPKWGFGNDFMRFVDVDSTQWREADDALVTEVALDTIRTVAGRPWFLYVHTMGPHGPHEAPSPEYRDKFVRASYDDLGDRAQYERILDLYDGEIAYTDMQLGRLIERLKAEGEYDNTLIVVLSDHGEQLGEHGHVGHGYSLFEQELRVPLVVKLPGNAHRGEQRHGLIEIVDLAPTILDLAGAPPGPGLSGCSFAELFEADPEAAERIGYSSLTICRKSQRAAKTTRHKFIEDFVGGTKHWFDLEHDPLEQSPAQAPLPGAEPLELYAGRMASRGAAGLHILVTGKQGETHQVTGALTGKGIGAFNLRYPKRPARAEAADGTLRFEISMEPPKGGDAYAYWQFWRGQLEQDNARLSVEVDPQLPLALDIRIDGKPVPLESVSVGRDAEHVVLDGSSPFRPIDWAAGPGAYDPALLPPGLAVYVWYVPDVLKLNEEELDEEMQDALRGLGYLG